MTQDSQRNYQDDVDQYILNKLDPQERLEFEKRLKTDKVLSEMLQLTQYVVDGLAEEKLNEILSRLPDRVDIDNIVATGAPKNLMRRMMIALITVVAVVVFCILYVGNSSRYSTTELYNSYYVVQPHELHPHTRRQFAHSRATDSI